MTAYADFHRRSWGLRADGVVEGKKKRGADIETIAVAAAVAAE